MGKTRGLTAAGREDAAEWWKLGGIDDSALLSDTVFFTSTGIGGAGAGARTRFDACSGGGTGTVAFPRFTPVFVAAVEFDLEAPFLSAIVPIIMDFIRFLAY